MRNRRNTLNSSQISTGTIPRVICLDEWIKVQNIWRPQNCLSKVHLQRGYDSSAILTPLVIHYQMCMESEKGTYLHVIKTMFFSNPWAGLYLQEVKGGMRKGICKGAALLDPIEWDDSWIHRILWSIWIMFEWAVTSDSKVALEAQEKTLSCCPSL